MTSASQKLLLTLANILIPIAILTFAVGFFPYKPFIPGLATFQHLDQYDELPVAPFDKVVFMVVDALRSDFVYSSNSGFKFTQSLIATGSALPFTAHATSPTITMPRVKAITTGSIPSFLDVILNFAESDTTSTLANQDTWLAQLVAKPEGKLVMYGDDTWLKLFPETFSRADGTSSFFVSDFTEVDNNVTRHVPEELNNSDWSGMIMHYLGLDHIGHKTGPQGPQMIPKQIEMDNIVRQIYDAIETKPHLESTLLVLCGDHGMNEGGNHGGSAPGETSPALVFMSPKFKQISGGLISPAEPQSEFHYYTKIQQSDIAPTLAGLLGFPVPRNNLGVFIPELLQLFNPNERVQLFHRNALQILDIVKATFPTIDFQSKYEKAHCEQPSSAGQDLGCKWRRAAELVGSQSAIETSSDAAIAAFLDFCRLAQDELSSTASNYNVSLLVAGLSLSVIGLALALLAIRKALYHPSITGSFMTVIILLYGVMMFASSYVEEEHHFWYWTASAWFFYLFVDSVRQSSANMRILLNPYIFILILLRITRRYNQTGQKYAGAPDIVHSTFLTTPWILWVLIGVTYAAFVVSLKSDFAGTGTRDDSEILSPWEYSPEELLAISAASSIGALAFAFKLAFTARDAPELIEGLWPGKFRLVEWLDEVPLVVLARMVFILLGLGGVWVFAVMIRKEREGYRRLATGIFDLLSVFIITQTRSQNIPLFFVFRAMFSLLESSPFPQGSTTTAITITTLLLSHVSFYALGNSNAISSIDLSNAYNGVSGYNVGAVGILVFASNWAGPIWWCLAGVRLLQVSAARDAEAIKSKTGKKKRVSFRETIDEEERSPAAKKGAAANGKQIPGGKEEETKETPLRPWIKEERQALVTPTASALSATSSLSALSNEPIVHYIGLLTVFTTASLIAIMAACTMLRTHLFIWTVFSPKYLYAMAWGTLWHLGINIGLAWGVWKA